MRVRVLLLQDGLDAQTECLHAERVRADDAELELASSDAHAEQCAMATERAISELRYKARELDMLKVS